MADGFAKLPQPSYYAVIFSSRRNDDDAAGYDETSSRRVELARQEAGFLGVESTRDAAAFGITVAYWDSEDAIKVWRLHAEHTAARERGRRDWYQGFEIRVAKVERASSWCKESANAG